MTGRDYLRLAFAIVLLSIALAFMIGTAEGGLLALLAVVLVVSGVLD